MLKYRLDLCKAPLSLTHQTQWSLRTWKRYKNTFGSQEQAIQLIKRDKKVLLQLYQRPEILFTHGKGCTLIDSTGKEYLDLTAGIAVNALGHNHPAVLKAIQEQSNKLIHISNLYHNEHAGDFAMQLVQPLDTPDEFKVFLCNSGTEANEAAIKFARKWGNINSPQKNVIISFTNGFHGRSMGALSATPSIKYQTPFLPMLPGFEHCVFNDVNEFTQLMAMDNVCGVILEPVQGEGGIHQATLEFMQVVRQKCFEYNALMIVDEIQAGIGRTGKFYAHQWYDNITPDMITLAKPLANGIPSGAVIVSQKVAEVLKPGDHGTTFGGSPFSSAVGKACLKEINTPEFLQHVTEMGNYFKDELQELAAGSPLITEVRGIGLILGIQFHEKVDTQLFVNFCRERQMLVVGAGSNTVRFVPPLIITKEELKQAISIIEQVFQDMESLIARGKD